MNWNPEEFAPITPPASPPAAAADKRDLGAAAIRGHGEPSSRPEVEANIIARSIFGHEPQPITGIDYAIEYKLADGYAGGDVVDVYEFDNGSIAFSSADVQGRGVNAATLATLIKFALRAYASSGMMPEATMAHLDRLYLEHCAFEKVQSFASVFFAMVDVQRRILGYSSAGHDVAALMRPGESAVLLPVTAPVIGVFVDHRDLFRQRYLELVGGSILVLATDGITEARNDAGEMFGSERFTQTVTRCRDLPVRELAATLLDETLTFSGKSATDDIAILVVRFH